MCHGCLFEVPRVFQGCFKEVLGGVTENLNGVSRKFKGCFEEASRVLQESSNGVKVRLKGITSSCQGVSMVFERGLK